MEHPSIKLKVASVDPSSATGQGLDLEGWTDWETLSIPGRTSPSTSSQTVHPCKSTSGKKWRVYKTKNLGKRESIRKKSRKTYTFLNNHGKLEEWECIPLYRIYLKKSSSAGKECSHSDRDQSVVTITDDDQAVLAADLDSLLENYQHEQRQ